LEFGGCSSNVNLTRINGNVIISGWKDDKPAMKEEKGLDIGYLGEYLGVRPNNNANAGF
jgi:hypothetical protein